MDILKKEEEFRVEIEGLEKQTKKILRKVKEATNVSTSNSDNFKEHLEKVHSVMNLRIEDTFKISTMEEKHNSMDKSSKKLKNNKEDIENFMENLEQVPAKGLMPIFRAKLRIMETEHERLKNEYKKKIEENKRLQLENQNLLQDKEKWFLQYNSSLHSNNKQEKYIQSIHDKLLQKESQEVVLKKEVEDLKAELRALSTNLQHLQARFHRTIEDNSKLKISVSESKEKEKELKETSKKQLNELTTKLRKSEKQKNELLQGFKKQILLIDNLRKQKNHLEVLKIGEMTESEFMKILDWNVD